MDISFKEILIFGFSHQFLNFIWICKFNLEQPACKQLEEHYYTNANKTTVFNDVLLGNQPCEDADHVCQGLVLHPSCVPANVGINKNLY
jgi:hypothetical protein